GYKRHKDQFKNDSSRKYSLINYLNSNWLEEDGGQLIIYQNEEIQKIQPQSQTAVFFKSNEMEHEVAKANRSRMSISGWLKSV
ncbi:MAG: 2OG-Fe(II) oxygenase, partial [Ferruginibacter sp.]|nr:2OG-Fe(II) oxygenase [Ferruginibacter sp.]